jgi:hypothetical protein
MISSRSKEVFPPSHCSLDWLWVHPACCSRGKGRSFVGVNWLRCDTNHSISPHSSHSSWHGVSFVSLSIRILLASCSS